MLGCSGFGDDFLIIEASSSNDIQNITFLGGCFVQNDAAVCGGRIWFIFFFVSGMTY